MEEITTLIKNHVHIGLGGVLALWLYKDKVDKMQLWERFAYCAASIFVGVYGGNGINEWFAINQASHKAHLISVLVAIFGLAILSLIREHVPSIAVTLRKKWFGE